MRLSSVAAALLCVLASGAWAGGSGVGSAREFAEENCAACHAIDAEGESPLATAPAFRTFGENWPVEQLAEALAEGIVVGHEAMPEFTLTPDQIRDFIGYLKSLGRP